MSTTMEAIMAQYEKNKQSTSGNANKVSQEDRQKKYFTTLLPKGSKGEERRIRILPTKDGTSPFVEVYFHEIQVDGKWIKIYDPKQEGKRSPLNEVYEELMKTGVDSDRETAKQYRAKRFYIVRVIDRDNEQDGVKFWRFKHNAKGEGNLDKIFPIFRNKGDVTDPEKGRDLILSLTLSKSGNGKEYTSISSVIPDDPSPLHKDKKIAKEWLSDELVWSDVYSKRGEDYLDMIARGEVPRWDNVNNKWTSNSSADEMLVSPTKTTSQAVVDAQEDDDPDTDLPF